MLVLRHTHWFDLVSFEFGVCADGVRWVPLMDMEEEGGSCRTLISNRGLEFMDIQSTHARAIAPM